MALQSRELVFEGSRYLLPPNAFFSRDNLSLFLKVSNGGFALSLPLEALSAASSAPSAAAHQLKDETSEQIPAAGAPFAP